MLGEDAAVEVDFFAELLKLTESPISAIFLEEDPSNASLSLADAGMLAMAGNLGNAPYNMGAGLGAAGGSLSQVHAATNALIQHSQNQAQAAATASAQIPGVPGQIQGQGPAQVPNAQRAANPYPHIPAGMPLKDNFKTQVQPMDAGTMNELNGMLNTSNAKAQRRNIFAYKPKNTQAQASAPAPTSAQAQAQVPPSAQMPAQAQPQTQVQTPGQVQAATQSSASDFAQGSTRFSGQNTHRLSSVGTNAWQTSNQTGASGLPNGVQGTQIEAQDNAQAQAGTQAQARTMASSQVKINLPQAKTNPIDQQLDRLPRFGALSARPPVEQQGAIASQVQGLAVNRTAPAQAQGQPQIQPQAHNQSQPQVQPQAQSQPQGPIAQSQFQSASDSASVSATAQGVGKVGLTVAEIEQFMAALSAGPQAAYAQLEIAAKKLGLTPQQYEEAKLSLEETFKSQQHLAEVRQNYLAAQQRDIAARQSYEANARRMQRQQNNQSPFAPAYGQSQSQYQTQPQASSGQVPFGQPQLQQTQALFQAPPQAQAQAYAQPGNMMAYYGKALGQAYGQGTHYGQYPVANNNYQGQRGRYHNPNFPQNLGMGQNYQNYGAPAVPGAYGIPGAAYAPGQGPVQGAIPGSMPGPMSGQVQGVVPSQAFGPAGQNHGFAQRYALGQGSGNGFGPRFIQGPGSAQATAYTPEGPGAQGASSAPGMQPWANMGKGARYGGQMDDPLRDIPFGPVDAGGMPENFDAYAYPEYQDGDDLPFDGVGQGPQGGFGEGFNLPSRQQRAQAAALHATQEAFAAGALEQGNQSGLPNSSIDPGAPLNSFGRMQAPASSQWSMSPQAQGTQPGLNGGAYLNQAWGQNAPVLASDQAQGQDLAQTKSLTGGAPYQGTPQANTAKTNANGQGKLNPQTNVQTNVNAQASTNVQAPANAQAQGNDQVSGNASASASGLAAVNNSPTSHSNGSEVSADGVYSGRKSNLPEYDYASDNLEQAATQTVNVHTAMGALQPTKKDTARVKYDLEQRDYYFELLKNTADYIYDMQEVLNQLCSTNYDAASENKKIDAILATLPDSMIRAKENQLKQQSGQAQGDKLPFANPPLKNTAQNEGGAAKANAAKGTSAKSQAQSQTPAQAGANGISAVGTQPGALEQPEGDFSLSQQGVGGMDVNDPRYLGAQLVGSVSLKDKTSTLTLDHNGALVSAAGLASAQVSVQAQAQASGAVSSSAEGTTPATAPEDLVQASAGFNPNKAQTQPVHLQNAESAPVGKTEQLVEQAKVQAQENNERVGGNASLSTVSPVSSASTANTTNSAINASHAQTPVHAGQPTSQLVPGSVGVAVAPSGQAQSSLNNLVSSLKQQEGHSDFNVDDIFGSTIGDKLDVTKASDSSTVPALSQPGGKGPSSEDLPPWEMRDNKLQQGALNLAQGQDLNVSVANAVNGAVDISAEVAEDNLSAEVLANTQDKVTPGITSNLGSAAVTGTGASISGMTGMTGLGVSGNGYLPAQAKLPPVPNDSAMHIEAVDQSSVDRCGVNLVQSPAASATSHFNQPAHASTNAGSGSATIALSGNNPLPQKANLDSFEFLDSIDRKASAELENQVVYAPSPWELAAQAAVVQVGDKDINLEHVKVAAPVPINRNSQIGNLHQDELEPPLFTGLCDPQFGQALDLNALPQIVAEYEIQCQQEEAQRQERRQKVAKLREIYPNLGRPTYAYQLIVFTYNAQAKAELLEKHGTEIAALQQRAANQSPAQTQGQALTQAQVQAQTQWQAQAQGQVANNGQAPGQGFVQGSVQAMVQGQDQGQSPGFAAAANAGIVPGNLANQANAGAVGAVGCAGDTFSNSIDGRDPAEEALKLNKELAEQRQRDGVPVNEWDANEGDDLDDEFEDSPTHINKAAYMDALVDLERTEEEDDDFSERHSFTDMELDISAFSSSQDKEPESEPEIPELGDADGDNYDIVPRGDGAPGEFDDLGPNQVHHLLVNIPGMRLLNQEDYLQMLSSKDPWYNLLASVFPDRGLYYGILVTVERQVDPNAPNHWTLLVDKEQDLSSLKQNFWDEVQEKFESYLKQKLKFNIVMVNEQPANCPVSDAARLEREMIEKERRGVIRLPGLIELMGKLNEDGSQLGIELYTKTAVDSGDAAAS